MSYPFTIVVGEKMKGPDDYREVIDRVRKDYRSYLDTCWMRELSESGKVEINQEVLKQLIITDVTDYSLSSYLK